MPADDYTPFTPHLDSLQTAWVVMCQQSRVATQPSVEALEAEFDRAIARVRAEAGAQALRDAADGIEQVHAPQRHSRWLRARADTITQEDTP